ncbi:putative reverse transcriptase domain-containing protein [Tanacetum coccineum]
MLKRKAVKKIVKKRVSEAIAKYEKTRANQDNAGGSGSVNAGGSRSVNAGGIDAPKVHGCTYKTFLNCQPHKFNGTKGVVGLTRWFEKMEHVFEFSKCAEEDKVKFAACTFEGRALTWWNGNVHSLGLANANQIPWNNVHEHQSTWVHVLLCFVVRCHKVGHHEKDCRTRIPAACGTSLQNVTCFGCEDNGREGALHEQNPNVVTTTFLLNDYYANILFDSGAEKSFVSTAFTPFIDIAPTALDTSYEVELAYGKVVSTNTVLRSCPLALFNHCFKIGLLPIRLGKRPKKDPRSLSCIKADEKKLEDIPIVRDFPEVFPDDLSGLPPMCEIEFHIDLILGVFPVVK